ncbi:Protein CBG25168 [Caenorhabditis briggsae]|uniref:Protein CBG25168 n=1 Tax=Caenorhabditis briggsae TaxID=6238 RepID=B6IEL9_CAEBR|nr:Protein CBG25168 [Caenorhabditis briggsae]CAR98349.1 Protein CBG25168 [Caenorhabditis briggsae]
METGFLYRNGEVSLKDLEIWYDHGLVTPEDRITICETNGERSIFKISTLINLYGSEAPFKLIPLKPLPTPRSISSAPKKAPPPRASGPTEPLKAEAASPVCPRIIENDKFQSSAPKGNGRSFLHGYIRTSRHTEIRRNSRKEIYEAMKDLEMIYNQLPMSYIIKKFDFLKRRNFANGSFSTAICRLCNQTPYGIELFFNHLFSEGHIKLLCHFSISMQSICWWMEQFQNRPQAIPAQIPVIETPKRVVEVLETPPIPLFYSNTSNDIRKLSTFDISQFGFHFAQLQWKYGIYLERRFSKIRIPDFCNLCQEKVVPNHFGMTSHIFSNRHLNGLTGISKSDLNFWNNYFKLEVEMEQVPIDVKKRILNFRSEY